MKSELKEALDALRTAELVIAELYKELGKKKVADWNVINSGELAIKHAIANLEVSL